MWQLDLKGWQWLPNISQTQMLTYSVAIFTGAHMYRRTPWMRWYAMLTQAMTIHTMIHKIWLTWPLPTVTYCDNIGGIQRDLITMQSAVRSCNTYSYCDHIRLHRFYVEWWSWETALKILGPKCEPSALQYMSCYWSLPDLYCNMVLRQKYLDIANICKDSIDCLSVFFWAGGKGGGSDIKRQRYTHSVMQLWE